MTYSNMKCWAKLMGSPPLQVKNLLDCEFLPRNELKLIIRLPQLRALKTSWRQHVFLWLQNSECRSPRPMFKNWSNIYWEVESGPACIIRCSSYSREVRERLKDRSAQCLKEHYSRLEKASDAESQLGKMSNRSGMTNYKISNEQCYVLPRTDQFLWHILQSLLSILHGMLLQAVGSYTPFLL